MSESYAWGIKSYAWVGPQKITQNGLELHAVVAQDQRGNYHAGTRYGPRGSAMPELGWEDFWTMDVYRAKDEAMFAAARDAAQTLRECNDFARTQALLEAATAPKDAAKKTTLPPSSAD